MADDADRAAEADEQAMARFEAEQRERRIAESFRGFDRDAPRSCGGCDGQIEPERTRLLITTRLCAACAREAERQLREGAWT